MKAWKLSLYATVFLLFFGTITLVSVIWSNLSSAWNVSRQTAQFALNHSSVDHILSHDTFTASDVEDVYYGIDAFSHPWYVFVWTNPLRSAQVPAGGVISLRAIEKQAISQGLQVITAKIGYLDNQTANTFHTTSMVVWEAYGSIDGKQAYYYYDGWTGKLLWKYVL